MIIGNPQVLINSAWLEINYRSQDLMEKPMAKKSSKKKVKALKKEIKSRKAKVAKQEGKIKKLKKKLKKKS